MSTKSTQSIPSTFAFILAAEPILAYWCSMASDKNSSRVWFITGSSTGFGRVLAEILLKRGERVVVTARSPDQIQDLVAGYKDTGLALALDVTHKKRWPPRSKSSHLALSKRHRLQKPRHPFLTRRFGGQKGTSKLPINRERHASVELVRSSMRSR